ncbi:LAMI_0C02828g1_1 [Lachancea mirantina]|uniref:LAMI_0C02828g1_1 n=1 Tax=Lachancea mirantina TaxID=1230905 RepID=A0A1G4J1H0_9SACH|nr:LAMI_0C02828g1_1 [Lachancea mirantina]
MCLCCVCCTVSDLILYVVAFFLPPVAVLLRAGLYSSDFLLNLLLTLFGFVPGLIHAFYFITTSSPLRRNQEAVYYYQSGWQDSRRGRDDGNGRNGTSRQYVAQQPPSVAPGPSVHTPLLLDGSNSSREDPDAKGPPPPYSEMV